MDKIDILTAILMGASTSVMFLCALVLQRGGIYAFGMQFKKPSKMQRVFAICLLANAFIMVMYMFNMYLLDDPVPAVFLVCDTLGDISLGFIPLEALVLQQVATGLKHYVVTFGPTLPLFVISFFSDDDSLTYIIIACATELYLVCLIIYSLFVLKKWDERILNYYSEVAHKQTVWFRQLCIPFLLFPVMWSVLYFFPEAKWMNLVYYLVLIVIFVRFTSMALAQEEVELRMENEELRMENDEDTMKDGMVEPVWAEKLDVLMVEKKVYKQDDLTAGELAKMLNVNRTYLSNYLNSQRGMNFYDFINEYRLDECERLLKERVHSITEISVLCGFKDRNALYRIFRRRHDMSPTEWSNSSRIKNGHISKL